MSTASSLVAARTGAGARFAMTVRYQPAGQFACHVLLATRATARERVRTSTGVACWDDAAASFARASALSFPGSPQWDGTHCK